MFTTHPHPFFNEEEKGPPVELYGIPSTHWSTSVANKLSYSDIECKYTYVCTVVSHSLFSYSK